jgi:hypothetical protein
MQSAGDVFVTVPCHLFNGPPLKKEKEKEKVLNQH